MAPPKKILAEKTREMMDFITTTIGNLVTSHYPSATPGKIGEHETAFGIDRPLRQHPVEQLHSARLFAPTPGHEDMFPGFLHVSFNLTPADHTQDHTLRSDQTSELDLRRDFNRLITGNPDGEQIDAVVAKDSDGKVTNWGKLNKANAVVSGQYHEGGINLITYGSLVEIYDSMKANLAKDENADLRVHAPKSTGRKSTK